MLTSMDSQPPTSEGAFYAVIMAGGSGTRFWPASRRSRPKQFLPIGSELPMITATAQRLEGLVPLERVLVVTSGDLAAQVTTCLPDLPPANVLVEPVGRNTAPCVALAALEIERRSPGAVQVVLPADHVIEPAEDFRASLRAAAQEARRASNLVTLGVRPTFPATGYGYIEQGAEVAQHGEFRAHRVERFVEKPELTRAQSFMEAGNFLWNAGIFVWESRTVIEALRKFAPEILEPLEQAGRSTDLGDIFPGLPALPVDIAVMERAQNRSVLPIDYRWDDVGSWTSLPEVSEADEAGNCKSGQSQVICEDARGNIVFGEAGTLTALIGVQDLVVVRSGDAVLVCPKDRAQDVKLIVERLKTEGKDFL
ncbi:MAG: mannose-1-phosphate guanylyltransferase [Candidatus Paceibacteria bacterium]|jgi:mannose-1-phosphate guanylyltransferase